MGVTAKVHTDHEAAHDDNDDDVTKRELIQVFELVAVDDRLGSGSKYLGCTR